MSCIHYRLINLNATAAHSNYLAGKFRMIHFLISNILHEKKIRLTQIILQGNSIKIDFLFQIYYTKKKNMTLEPDRLSKIYL